MSSSDVEYDILYQDTNYKATTETEKQAKFGGGGAGVGRGAWSVEYVLRSVNGISGDTVCPLSVTHLQDTRTLGGH